MPQETKPVTTELPDRFDLATEPPADERLAALRELFPEVMREDQVDFDALRRSLGDWVDTGPERFGLSWPGKAECMRVIQEPSIGTLVPMPDESVDWDTTQNVIIEGENLEVLKLLQKAYYGKVKLIYIDPPYNTGKEFIYPDNFKEGLTDYLRYSGQVSEDGLRLTANAETDGRYHSKWLSMIYPRLFLARNLLRDDGAIFVSVDDHELPRLLCMLDEIFGPENFVATIVWKNATDNNPTRVAVEHEYMVCYARNLEASAPVWKSADSAARDLLVQIGTELAARFSDQAELQAAYTAWFRENRSVLGPLDRYKYVDADGVYTGSQSVHNPGKEGYRYDVIHPVTGRPCKQPLLGYRFPSETMDRLLADGRIIFGDDETKIVELKVYAKDFMQKFSSVIELDGRLGANELRRLFPESAKVFTNPKPVSLLKDIMSFVVASGDLVLDFFAGSGTLAQACMQLASQLNLHLQYVLVQLPEPIDGDSSSISRLMMERVRRAGKELAATKVDLGFRAYELRRSNFSVWDGTSGGDDSQIVEQLAMAVDHVREDATELGTLSELLLKAGYPLTSPTEQVTFAGVSGYSVADGALLVCLSDSLTIEAFEVMVGTEPAMILVLDAGFGGSDELKVNALQTVRARNQQSGSDIALRVV
jgi:adenine-specific DNA-methyltransferase